MNLGQKTPVFIYSEYNLTVLESISQGHGKFLRKEFCFRMIFFKHH